MNTYVFVLMFAVAQFFGIQAHAESAVVCSSGLQTVALLAQDRATFENFPGITHDTPLECTRTTGSFGPFGATYTYVCEDDGNSFEFNTTVVAGMTSVQMFNSAGSPFFNAACGLGEWHDN